MELIQWILYLSFLVRSSLNSESVPVRCRPREGPPEYCGRYTCMNGHCIKSDHPYYQSCKCDGPWYGSNCDKCCDLQCIHGICVLDNYRPKCRCDDGYSGDECEVEECKRNCHNGDCVIKRPGEHTCHCHQGFKGEDCKDIDQWKQPMFCVFMSLSVVLVIFMIVMPYVMWRKRALIILKIHYFFQRYEDDDSCRFDVFISYGREEEDGEFVVNTLVPILEKSMGFRACYADRNFVYGEAYIDNITAAIKQSRRTILVITPRYLVDEWPVFEALQAQLQSLSSAHKLIPVVFEGARIEHPTLRNIVSSLLVIKWPEQITEMGMKRFEKRLRYCMPKLKHQDP